MSALNSDVVWTVEDVAEYLGVPPRTLADQIRRGDGPPKRKVGKRYLFNPRAVKAWLAEGC